jgi:hypothetical protein
MKVSLESRRPAQSRADVVVLGRHTDGAPGEVADVDQRLGGFLSRVLAAEKFEAGGAGERGRGDGAARRLGDGAARP